eukprot:3669851-Amphidinium_carterae.1
MLSREGDAWWIWHSLSTIDTHAILLHYSSPLDGLVPATIMLLSGIRCLRGDFLLKAERWQSVERLALSGTCIAGRRVVESPSNTTRNSNEAKSKVSGSCL